MSRCILTVLNNDDSIVSVELKGDCIIEHDKEYDTWRCTNKKAFDNKLLEEIWKKILE